MNRNADYTAICAQLKALTDGIPYETANLANASALLWQELKDINWAGFYKMEDGALVLGPFQGPIACTRIKKGRGVCGTTWQKAETIIVPDVEQFPGHIACSSASRSEIVVPLFHNNEVVAVLDIDSEFLNTFDDTDKLWLERIVALLADVM
jgi:GAF domain-containing protein